jgi:hypothetical protein
VDSSILQAVEQMIKSQDSATFVFRKLAYSLIPEENIWAGKTGSEMREEYHDELFAINDFISRRFPSDVWFKSKFDQVVSQITVDQKVKVQKLQNKCREDSKSTPKPTTLSVSKLTPKASTSSIKVTKVKKPSPETSFSEAESEISTLMLSSSSSNNDDHRHQSPSSSPIYTPKASTSTNAASRKRVNFLQETDTEDDQESKDKKSKQLEDDEDESLFKQILNTYDSD